jgi:hypothetical protein
MKTPKRKRIRWCIGSQAVTLNYLHRIDEAERRYAHFPDGHINAIRIQIHRDTGEPIFNADGTAQIVAPWLLSDIFSLPNKK